MLLAMPGFQSWKAHFPLADHPGLAGMVPGADHIGDQRNGPVAAHSLDNALHVWHRVFALSGALLAGVCLRAGLVYFVVRWETHEPA
jgi:hypothetical protein